MFTQNAQATYLARKSYLYTLFSESVDQRERVLPQQKGISINDIEE